MSTEESRRFELRLWNSRVSDSEIISDLRRIAQLLERGTVTTKEYDVHGQYSTSTIEKKFKTWNNALKSAGLQLSNRRDITEVELFENLEEVWIRLGKQPAARDLKRNSKFGATTYIRRFDGWNKALSAFALWANDGGAVKEPSGPATSERPIKTPRDTNLRLRFLVMKRDRFCCRSCGRSPATRPGTVLHVDHVVPWSKGGLTTLENLQTLCSSCNLGKSNLI